MGEPALNVGVVDIGTNSMRLLITNGATEAGRWVEVTGLGRGVDATGRLNDDSVDTTIAALSRFGFLMSDHSVDLRVAVATSACRDAANREDFFDRAQVALGVRPRLISGEDEAVYAFAGATTRLDTTDGVVVSDIGGGSTEIVRADWSASIDIGSVRLTDRILAEIPPSESKLTEAVEHVADLFKNVETGGVNTHIGVAGTWMSLAAISEGQGGESSPLGGNGLFTYADLLSVMDLLKTLTIEQTSRLPGLDPRRAPVILAGAVIAAGVTEKLGTDVVLVSHQDTLDGVAAELLALR